MCLMKKKIKELLLQFLGSNKELLFMVLLYLLVVLLLLTSLYQNALILLRVQKEPPMMIDLTYLKWNIAYSEDHFLIAKNTGIGLKAQLNL